MKNKALKRLIYGLSLLLTFTPVFSFALTTHTKQDTVTTTGYKLRTIIVDPGHGGKPSGTTGTYSHGASGSYSLERNVTLALAFKLQKELEKELPSVKVVLTRSTDDDVSLQRRAQIANENKGDLFISLHCNSLPDRHVRELVGHKHHKAIYRTVDIPDHSGRGVLMLVYGFWRSREGENAIKQNLIEGGDSELNDNPDPNDPEAMILMNEYKRKYRQRSIHLAELIDHELVDTDGRHNEGIREQGVHVLCHSAMPAVLVETGYIDNADDEAYLNSEKGQDEIVASIVRAIESYKDEVEQVSP
ncbi:N-acetylmuramoyl-L-alanine amidase family protein [Mucilaginibacter gotjawali]|uniref:N-acetylmuramoyl-L-alanine amidase n=2 Tax=Mucilaginibacter gotjawali TaxID=1550579 RepID=A0A0X8X2Y8_9SPHI|nr:N-acetylmuramoyl-L-alanine amidase [Mucilaginibacter gotjawali]MBB3058234.1 N-acetylmuramoyl-L-alanine amidase [Mucilaginibacter gotjawali]BAU54810.1 N-acetylmuramoyl-L-alanine amidase AmiC precursor [Mucilaginibacter gotjawali]